MTFELMQTVSLEQNMKICKSLLKLNFSGSPIVQLDCSGKQYFQAEANDQSCIIPFVDFYEYDVENTDDNGKEGGGNEDGNDDETDE